MEYRDPREMAHRVCDFDWGTTPLGPKASWPQSLRTAVQLMLDVPFPSIVLWGPNLIQIYNEGYRPLMGNKHPAGLGQPTQECWPEVWHINESIYKRVFAGESIYLEDALYPITRSGLLQDFWLPLSYSPIRDESGNVAGVLVAVFETTRRAQVEGAAQATLERLAQTNEDLERRVQERTQELSDANNLRRDLLHRLVNAQEEERGHIARELHDNTGQLVTALSLGLDNLSSILPTPLSEDTATLLRQMRQISEELSGEARRLSASLRPTALDQFGLEKALRNYLEQWTSWSKLPLDYHPVGFEGPEGEGRLSRELESAAYRVVQEALTNILRHAGPSRTSRVESGHGQAPRRLRAKSASRVSVLLQRTATHLIAIVEDNGPGFHVEAAMSLPPDRRRLGLFSMKERAELVGGTLEIESRPGAGTTIIFRAPLSP